MKSYLVRVVCTFLAFSLWANPGFCDTSSGQVKRTTLRVQGSPEGTFKNWGTGTYVTRVQAEIKNVGKVEASGIRVEATLPGGQTVRLYGPKTLERNKGATYSASTHELVLSDKKIKVDPDCTNCR